MASHHLSCAILLFSPILLSMFSPAASQAPSSICRKPEEVQAVLVKSWINGAEGDTYEGVGARFGETIPPQEKKDNRLPAIFPEPLDCCSNLTSKLSGSIALCLRGTCEFSMKAEISQLGGAAGLLVLNNDEEGLPIMNCPNNTQTSTITIPTVIITKSDGEALTRAMSSDGRVELLFYAPDRPIVEMSVSLLWLMAVGTVACASLWSEFTACDQNDDPYNEMEPKNRCSRAGWWGSSKAGDDDNEVVEINMMSAVTFVITASAFLLLLYFFMSSWFVWVLITLFCIGGIQ